MRRSAQPRAERAMAAGAPFLRKHSIWLRCVNHFPSASLLLLFDVCLFARHHEQYFFCMQCNYWTEQGMTKAAAEERLATEGKNQLTPPQETAW